MPEPVLLPLVLLRGTGFAVELVDAAGTPDTVAAADVLRAAQRRLEAHRRHFLDTVFAGVVEAERAARAPRARFKHWYRTRRRIERYERVEAAAVPAGSDAATVAVETWNRLADEVARARVQLADTGRAEWSDTWRRLTAVASDERFGEAVFLSSPSMYRAVRRFVGRSQPDRDRRTGLQVYGYLQRFTMKNETTSFFGPIDHGVVRPDLAERLRFDAGSGGIGRRWSRVAYWAVQALADAIGADGFDGALAHPRLADGYRADDAGLLDALRDRRVALPAELHEVARRCDGRTPVPDRDIATLVGRSIVDRRLRLPTVVDDPLGWLRQRVAAAPGDPARRERWLGVIDTLAGLADRFAPAPVTEKEEILGRAEQIFGAATGTAGNRHGGLYTDRHLLFDEALGDLSVDIGPSMVDDLVGRLRPALDLCVTYSLILQDVIRERARDVARQMGGGHAVPYLAFIRRLLTTVDPARCGTDERVRGFLARLTAAVVAGPDGAPVRLDPAGLPRRAAPPATTVSPDLFLAAKSQDALAAGDYDVVIGEIHHGVQVWTHLLAFWPDLPGLDDALRAAMPAADLAATVHMRRQGKAFPRELPGYAVELTGRSTGTDDRVLRAADLDVVPTGDGVVLRHGRRTLRLHPGDPRAAANWVFGPPPVQAPPIRLGRHTPRVTVGGAVLQRETWYLAGADVAAARRAGSPHEAFALIRDLADRAGLPARWFAKVDGARKPFYVDLTSMVSVEHLFTQVNPAANLRCTELLPDPESCWLPAAGGGRRGAEWRTSWVYGGSR